MGSSLDWEIVDAEGEPHLFYVEYDISGSYSKGNFENPPEGPEVDVHSITPYVGKNKLGAEIPPAEWPQHGFDNAEINQIIERALEADGPDEGLRFEGLENQEAFLKDLEVLLGSLSNEMFTNAIAVQHSNDPQEDTDIEIVSYPSKVVRIFQPDSRWWTEDNVTVEAEIDAELELTGLAPDREERGEPSKDDFSDKLAIGIEEDYQKALTPGIEQLFQKHFPDMVVYVTASMFSNMKGVSITIEAEPKTVAVGRELSRTESRDRWVRLKGGFGDWPAGTEVTITHDNRNSDGSRDVGIKGPGGKQDQLSLDAGEDLGKYVEMLEMRKIGMSMNEMRGLAGLSTKPEGSNIKVTDGDRNVQRDWRRMAINPSKNLVETSETSGGAIVPAGFVFPDMGSLLGYTQKKLPVSLLRSIDRMTSEGQNTMALMLNELQKLKPATDQLVEIFAGLVDGIDKFDGGSIEGREVARVFRFLADAARFTQGGAELTEQL